MLNRHSFAVVLTLCTGMSIGWVTPVQAQNAGGSQPTSIELYERGVADFQAGDIESAKALLRRVDPMQLPKADRVKLYEALKQLDAAGTSAPAVVDEVKDAVTPEPAPAAQPEAPEAPAKPEVMEAPQAAPMPETAKAPEAPATPETPDAKARYEAAQRQAQNRGDGDIPAASDDLLLAAQKAYALDLAAQASEAQQQGYHELAINLYSEAAELDPDNAEVQRKLDAAVAARNAALAAPANVLGEAQQLESLQIQAANAAYSEAMNKAREQLGAGNYAAANDAVDRAKTVLEQNARLYTTTEFNSKRAAATDLAIAIKDTEAKAIAAAQEDDNQKRTQLEKEAQRKAERAQREEVKRLIISARDLQRQMRYKEALDLIDQVLFIDPLDYRAQGLRDMMVDMINIQDQHRSMKLRGQMMGAQAAQNLEATIPYDDLLVYPSDWPELTQRRLEALDLSGGESRANRETSQKLDINVPINFEANPLDAVIAYLRTTTGANIFVNWPALNSEGIEEDMPITLQLNEVPARLALDKVLQLANAVADSGNPAIYSIIDGVVEVSTQSQLNQTTDARVYDIRDLLVQVPNFIDAPEFDLGEALQGSSGGGGGGGGGSSSSIFGDNQDENDQDQPTRAELIDQIQLLVQDTVGDPNEWIDQESTIRELNGNLIIKTTPTNHRQIVGVLNQLREQRATQISVEARFLLVDNNFIEEFGMDLDFRYKSSGNFGPITVDQNSFDIARRGATILTPSRFVGSGTDSNPTGLSLGVNFIDDLEVDLLVNATVANNRALTLTAPRITFFNGQRAYVVVARQVAFISDLEAVPDTNTFDVTVGYVNSGVVLDVEGTVSADRRYVTMTMRPSLATLIQPIRQVLITGAPTNNNNNNNNNTNNNNAAAQNLFSAPIELPELEITTVRSTVSVPDKGTLLLGGQRLVGEIEVEAGVPVLSKLPIINRLFTNTSTTKDERTLLILIKPTIILQGEQEDLLFPGLNDDPAKYNVGRSF